MAWPRLMKRFFAPKRFFTPDCDFGRTVFRSGTGLGDSASAGIRCAQLEQLNWLKTSHVTTPLTIWLKLDTGMHRLGFDERDMERVLTAIDRLPMSIHLNLMSHFASADTSDDFTQKQLSVFNRDVQLRTSEHRSMRIRPTTLPKSN